jgi:hypothetical protein
MISNPLHPFFFYLPFLIWPLRLTSGIPRAAESPGVSPGQGRRPFSVKMTLHLFGYALDLVTPTQYLKGKG